MLNNSNEGYAVETKDGEIIKVQNLATARYYLENGLAEKIIDLVFNRYIK